MKYLLLVLISINVFALDLTYDTDRGTDTTIGESNSKSKDLSIDNTKKSENSTTKSSDKSFTKSKRVDYDGKVRAIAYLAGLEKAGVSPFKECRLLTKPHRVEAFDLSCKMGGYGNSNNLCSYLKEQASNYALISEVVESEIEEDIKGYANCGVLYGGIIAQYLKTGVLDVEIKDQKIKSEMSNVTEEIFGSECNLADKTTVIMCDSVTLDISRTLRLTANSVEIFGGNEYFGYKLNLSKDKSFKNSLAKSFVKSKARSDSNKIAKSLKIDEGNTYKLSRKAAANMSVGKFVKE